ncbi:hypothetical protein [Bacillus sp. FJAT-44742]|uniref:hypothetical protein n=1 Tax=Bacillus sp. FJAT-44742 TaxID=2014005 RepID=UPI0018E24D64|nr:hypothetical protein [Bacillus sp. FJAT-44742]
MLTVMQIAVIDIIPVKHQGEGISFYTLSFILATAIGPFLGLVMIQLYKYTPAILTGIGILLTLFTTLPLIKFTR